MGSGEESIISSSCFWRPSATAWMALVHSSLRETQAARTDYISPFSTMRAQQPNHVIVFLSTGRQFQEWALPKASGPCAGAQQWLSAHILCIPHFKAAINSCSCFQCILSVWIICLPQFCEEADMFACHLPLLRGLHVEGALDDSGPLQAADDKCVGLGTLRLHQLALWPQPGRVRREMKRSV